LKPSGFIAFLDVARLLAESEAAHHSLDIVTGQQTDAAKRCCHEARLHLIYQLFTTTN
jgi:hypothetical protein